MPGHEETAIRPSPQETPYHDGRRPSGGADPEAGATKKGSVGPHNEPMVRREPSSVAASGAGPDPAPARAGATGRLFKLER
jgi:hypothetical protein